MLAGMCVMLCFEKGVPEDRVGVCDDVAVGGGEQVVVVDGGVGIAVVVADGGADDVADGAVVVVVDIDAVADAVVVAVVDMLDVNILQVEVVHWTHHCQHPQLVVEVSARQ